VLNRLHGHGPQAGVRALVFVSSCSVVLNTKNIREHLLDGTEDKLPRVDNGPYPCHYIRTKAQGAGSNRCRQGGGGGLMTLRFADDGMWRSSSGEGCP
jgi:hypothetical protein